MPGRSPAGYSCLAERGTGRILEDAHVLYTAGQTTNQGMEIVASDVTEDTEVESTDCFNWMRRWISVSEQADGLGSPQHGIAEPLERRTVIVDLKECDPEIQSFHISGDDRPGGVGIHQSRIMDEHGKQATEVQVVDRTPFVDHTWWDRNAPTHLFASRDRGDKLQIEKRCRSRTQCMNYRRCR